MSENPVDLITQILGSEWVEKQLDTYESFRHMWSPKTRWYHRRPTISPIVPLIYWNTRESFPEIRDPFGYWGGHPQEMLGRLAGELEQFREYWRLLPKNRGIENLRWAISNPQRFFSLSHELSIANQFAETRGVQVEPLFLDSQSMSGKPDLFVKTSRREFAVQCKSEDPSKAKQMPYDLFQYFAGIFQRLVEDSNRSYHLILQLKKNVDMGYINRIRNRMEKLIKGGITVPYPWSTTYCDFELSEIGIKLGTQTINQLRRRVHNLPGDPLYHEFVPIVDNISNISNRRGSVLFIYGRRGKELDWFISTAATRTVMEANTPLPLIIAIHLYQEIDFQEYQSRSSYKEKLLPWTNNFFKEHTNVAMIFLSSNRELYLPYDIGHEKTTVRHMRQGFVMESPEWDHSEVEELGI